MEPDATEQQPNTPGLTHAQPNNSYASQALTVRQPAADGGVRSLSVGGGRPPSITAAGSGSGANQALIWAPTGYKQQTYRPVQFRPYATSEAPPPAPSVSNDAASAASTVDSPRRASDAAEVYAFPSCEEPRQLSSELPTATSQVSQPPSRGTASLTQSSASEQSNFPFTDADLLRPTCASSLEQEPGSSKGLGALYHSTAAADASRALAQSTATVCPVEQQQDDAYAADHQSYDSGSGGSSPRLTSQLPQQRKPAQLPAVAPKPSKGVRLFIAQQHRGDSAGMSPEETAALPTPPDSRTHTDDDDVSSIASDTSSVGSSKLPPPIVPPKPKLRQTLSQASSENKDHVDHNNRTGSLQMQCSADGSTAALQANQTKEAVGSGTGMPEHQPLPPPVPQLRPRAPPPAQPASAPGIVKRKSLYEIVSTEGRREDKALPRWEPQQQQQQQVLLLVKEVESSSTSSQSCSSRQPGQGSSRPTVVSISQMVATAAAPAVAAPRYQRPGPAAAVPFAAGDACTAHDCTVPQGLTMPCSPCDGASSSSSSSSGAVSQVAAAAAPPPPPAVAGPGQQVPQQTSVIATNATTTDYDFPLRLPPTRPAFVTLLQKQRLEGRGEDAPTRAATSMPGSGMQLAARSPVPLGSGTALEDEPLFADTSVNSGGATMSQAASPPSIDLCCCGSGEVMLPPADSNSWTAESLDSSSRHPHGATAACATGSGALAAHSRHRPAGYMQTLLGLPTYERGRSLSDAGGGGGATDQRTNSPEGSSSSGSPASVSSPTSHRDWYKKMFKQLHSVEKQGEASFRILEAIKTYEEGGSFKDTDINDNHISLINNQQEDHTEHMDEEEKFLGYESSSSGGSVSSHNAYIRLQHGGEVPLTGFRKQLPQVAKSSSSQSAAVSRLEQLHPEAGYYRDPVLPDRKQREEQQTRRRQIMEQVEAEEKRRKAEKERLDQEARRHSDFFTPSAKVSITENRFNDFLASLPAKPQAKAATVQPRIKVRALFSFSAENPRELSFQKDDVICLIGQLDKHWLMGELNGNVGIFPGSYVEVSQNSPSADRPRDHEGSAHAKYNFKSEGGNELSLRKGDFVTLIRRVDANWYEVRSSNNRQGIAPVSYLEVHCEPSTGAKDSLPRVENRAAKAGDCCQGLTKASAPSLYTAMYDYQKQYPDELDLRQGDIVSVVESCDDGWLFGTLMRTGIFGTFPGNYVKPVEPSQAT